MLTKFYGIGRVLWMNLALYYEEPSGLYRWSRIVTVVSLRRFGRIAGVLNIRIPMCVCVIIIVSSTVLGGPWPPLEVS
jgi:hypothetical protein